MERDAVHKALMSLLRQDPKGNMICLQLLCLKILIFLYNYDETIKKLVNVNFSVAW